jgi:hypothetical protein
MVLGFEGRTKGLCEYLWSRMERTADLQSQRGMWERKDPQLVLGQKL